MSLLDKVENGLIDVKRAAVHHDQKLIVDEEITIDDLIRQSDYKLWVSFSVYLDLESYQKIYKRNQMIFSDHLLCIPYVKEVSDVYICKEYGINGLRMSIGLNVEIFDSALVVYRLIFAIVGIMSHIKSLRAVDFFWCDRKKVDAVIFLKDERLFDSVGQMFSYNIRQICRHLLGRPKSDFESDTIKKIIIGREERARVKSAVSRAVSSINVQSQEKPKIAQTPYTDFLGGSIRKFAF